MSFEFLSEIHGSSRKYLVGKDIKGLFKEDAIIVPTDIYSEDPGTI